MSGEKKAERADKRSLAEAKLVNSLFYYGMGSGVFISPIYHEEHQAVKEFINEEESKDIEPPRPPRRPNASIGGLALGNA